MELVANYHDCKIEVKAVIPGSLSSFIYAYCKTVNCPESLEPHFIRKTVSFAKLAKYVRMNLSNDFDLWYRKNEDSPALLEVLATMINTEDGRTETYKVPAANPFTLPLVSAPFRFKGWDLDLVLVQRIC